MLSVDEFIPKAVGVKWVDRAHSFEAMDCWGLVILYYRHVLNVELASVNGYESKTQTIETATAAELKANWIKCEPINHSIFVAYQAGQPVHVGIVIDGHALHAAGKNNRGQVQYNKLSALERLYKLEFYRYANLSQRPERAAR